MNNTNRGGDDFWDLGDYRKKHAPTPTNNVSRDTDAVSVSVGSQANVETVKETDRSINYQHFSDASITKFIPPRSDPAFKKKCVLLEYEPENPFIKTVKLLGENENSKLFPKDNLFMRERAALLDRSAIEVPFVPYYSYSPRYSQLTKPQLRYYLWWRHNLRQGIYLKTEVSYLMLYAYELAASGDGEDLKAALANLCALIVNYSSREFNSTIKMMIRDIICDFCLIHKLAPPMKLLSGIEPQIISRSFLPEMFAFSSDSIDASMSMYDYKKSKFYREYPEAFDKIMPEALGAVLSSEQAFEALTSFTKGLYGAVTSERHPFGRMVNIASKSVSVEVTYFELSNVRPAITDIVRYCENKLREHLGIKNKISIMSVNPTAKTVIDSFFENKYPPRPTIDRRRRDARIEDEIHEYDKLYDLPKTEISPEHAMEIERESWDTTKILTEAFATEDEQILEQNVIPEPISAPEPIAHEIPYVSVCADSFAPLSVKPADTANTYEQINAKVGKGAELIKLCLDSATAIEQRRFASSLGVSLDELADNINEAALDAVGDIVLESDGISYAVIDDYKHLFDL